MTSHRIAVATVFLAVVAAMFTLDDFPHRGGFVGASALVLVLVVVVYERMLKREQRRR
jgi:hypothetical protein